ncbi:MAG TPA: metalloregulator ArsR/SmtB family transcription factor [Arenibaculum sp.]|nr:metalloregulator ArsR/SmtB family transcription factor [Arenibaculum sp.]
MSQKAALAALSALAQETRLDIFRLLVQSGEPGRTAGAIAEALGVAPATLSFHLSQLTHAGLISQRRESRNLIYSADYDRMDALMAFLTENCCGVQTTRGPVCNRAGDPEPAEASISARNAG